MDEVEARRCLVALSQLCDNELSNWEKNFIEKCNSARVLSEGQIYKVYELYEMFCNELN